MSKTHSLVICTIANDRFIEGAIAWAKSVKKNASNRHAFVLDGGLSRVNILELEKIGVEVIKPERAIPFDHPRFGPAYALFDIGKIDADVVVYMDCDTILVGSLFYLEKIAMNYDIVVSPANSHWKMVAPDYFPSAKGIFENATTAAQEFLATSKSSVVDRLPQALNINTGVLCVKTEFMERVTEVASTYEPLFPELKNPDQELLSLVLAEMDIKPALLGWEFNATYIHGTADSKDGRLKKLSTVEMEAIDLQVSEKEVRAYRAPRGKLRAVDKKIEIVHYITSDKPWQDGNGIRPEARDLWRRYRNLSTEHLMRPTVSIIVVAYNIENFIEQCLYSCVFKGFSNYEVIVVENKSTDRTLEAVKRVQRQYPELIKIVENEKNYGLGVGRNIGLDHATGHHILFIDGDDWFAPNTFERLGQVISRHNPEVCLFNHARIFETAYAAPNKLSKFLWEGWRPHGFHRGAVMANLGVAWNKLYKRSFIDNHGLRFGEGFYEDIDWNFSVLLLSDRYYVIPDVLTNYRQRSGSITRSADPRHFDILSQYRRVMAILKTHPDKLKIYGNDVYKYARGQILNVIHDGNRLPKGDERHFLRQASRLLADFRKLTGRKSKNFRESVAATGNSKLYLLTHRFIRSFAPYEKRIVRQYRETKRVVDRHYRLWRFKAMVYAYQKFLTRLPIQENKVLFEAYWGGKMDCNPYALSKGLAETAQFECVWSLKDPSTARRTHKFDVVKRDSWGYWKAIATSKYFVSNVNFGEGIIKRPGQVHLQTWHGTPIKTMGLDIRARRPKEMNWKTFADKCKRWDFAISSNEHSTYVWRRSAPFNYKMIETGYPRNDIFFKETAEIQRRVREELGIPEGKKVAMYVPTFRDEEKKTNTVSKSPFDADKVQQALGEDWVLLMRAHHFSKARTKSKKDEAIIDVSDLPDFNELSLIADLLITDYSSAMFDFGCRMKPIVLFTYDYDKYVADRGVYFDIRDEAPGPVVETMLELEDCLREKTFDTDEHRQRLTVFNAKFCYLDDGHATDRVMEEVFGYEPTTSINTTGKAAA